MCRTKVKPHFRGKYVGRFLIHSTEEAAMVKWLRKFFLATRRAKKAARKMEEKEYELIRLLSVELLRVQCLQLIIGLAIHFHSCDVSSNRIEP